MEDKPLVDKVINEFYRTVKAEMPFGTTKRGIPVTIGKVKMSAVIFDPQGEKEVRFGLFLRQTRYSRKTLLVRASGIVLEDNKGVIPTQDFTKNEPDFAVMNDKEIVYAIAAKIKEFGSQKYLRKKQK